jgi:predicted ATPase/class 3 adenylate cyclase
MEKPLNVGANPHPSNVASSRPLPTGTVTFVMTDIEGSSARWDRYRAAMELAVRRHDALMREAIASHQGHVFKTIGDAFCAAFTRPEDAVAAMFDVQRALGAEDFSAVGGLRVRVAIHTGTADEREADYFGPAVNRVARLLGIGHGGQVLVSGVTGDLVQGSLPPEASLLDLGEHRLKDLSRPEHVYQLLGPDLIATFPPLRSVNALPNNLPRNTTSFVGREAEIAEIARLVEEHQLVTLVGSGGIGKTRTSLHVAAHLLDGSGDGVWFIELAPLASGEYIAPAIAAAMGLTLAADGDPIDNLVRVLKAKRALLVFDNCEHLVEGSAKVIAAIVRGCAEVRVLASSRQALGIGAERTYRLPSLAIPDASQAPLVTAASASQFAAVALFADRARAADDRFTLTDENAPIVADICRRLDGIALAIELAAARVKILSPKQLRDRLDERFRVLTGGSRDVLPRQQTLRALIDWSYDLLNERERALFRRLSIFVNGFSLEGASAAGSADDLDELDIFDVLASLVDKSLVLAEPAGDTVRYRMLESTRAYAREKLEAAGERERSAERHLRFLVGRYRTLGERLEATAREADLSEAFRLERDDVRAALEFALHGDHVSDGAALLAATRWSVWAAGGADHEAISRAEAYLAAISDDETVLRARLWTGISYLAGNQQRKTHAMEAATQAVSDARMSADPGVLRISLRLYAMAAIRLGQYDVAETSLSEAEALPDAPAVERVLHLATRAELNSVRGDKEAAVRSFEEILKAQQSLGNARGAGIATVHLAESLHATSKTGRAIELTRGFLPALHAAGDSNLLHCALANLAAYLVAADQFSDASVIARDLVREVAARNPTSMDIALVLEPLALAVAHGGDSTRAAVLEGYAEAAQRGSGCVRGFTETTSHDRLMALLAERLAPDDLSRALAEGAALAPEAAIALALDES